MENIFESEKKFIDLIKNANIGDILRIISGGKTYDANILNKTQSQLGVEMAGEKYIITPNSLEGDELISHRVSKGNTYKTTTRNITKISLIRDNHIIDSLNIKKNKKPSNKNDIILPFFKDAYKEIQNEFLKVNENSKLIIKTGELSTNDTINDKTINEIEFKVVKIFKGNILKVIIDKVSKNNNNLDKIKNAYLRLNLTNCLLIDQKGIKIEFKSMDKPHTKFFIENVFDVEVVDIPKTSNKVTLDDLWSKKEFRDLYNKEPSLFGKLLGQGPKGIAAVNQIMDKYNINKSYNTKNSKVQFEYKGKTIPTEIVKLTSGEQYVGRYINSREIKLINPNKRNISVTIKLIEKVTTNTYTIYVFKNTISNSQSVSNKIGEGIIKIIDNNFK